MSFSLFQGCSGKHVTSCTTLYRLQYVAWTVDFSAVTEFFQIGWFQVIVEYYSHKVLVQFNPNNTVYRHSTIC